MSIEKVKPKSDDGPDDTDSLKDNVPDDSEDYRFEKSVPDATDDASSEEQPD